MRNDVGIPAWVPLRPEPYKVDFESSGVDEVSLTRTGEPISLSFAELMQWVVLGGFVPEGRRFATKKSPLIGTEADRLDGESPMDALPTLPQGIP